ncbi:hypothetical protein WL29_22345 [Burkholderia ubonensis]|uniref:DUF4198 domain-containing protein n=1 Tax=Burkholderia ubonensis TaxID=101571 RepID=A0A106QD78_9BURK|nr:hypothetical protein [Burkholderia ubonensis]KWA84108.1 hypothetical protein WL29_22345 [Burkholderia ubonensis]
MQFNSALNTLLLAATFAGIALSSTASAADAPGFSAENVVPIAQEPNHHLVLETDVLRAFDVSFPSGAQSRWHSHSHDSVMVTLDGADVPSETPGKPIVKRPPIASGYIYYKPYGSEPFVHRISNVDTKTFRILDIELLAGLQGVKLAPLGDAWSTTLENERMRVSKTTVQPNAVLAAAPFKGPHLYVATTDGSYAVGELQMNVKRGSLLPDSTAKPEVIRNTGATPMELVVVELK